MLNKFDNNTKIIWHLSDLHFGNSFSSGGILDNVICQRIIKSIKFKLNKIYEFFKRFHLFFNPGIDSQSLLALRRSFKLRNACNDLVLVTGDLTKNGSKRNVKELKEFVDYISNCVGEVYLVPGNHDYWNGKSFLLTMIESLLAQIFACSWLNTNSIKNFFKLNLLNEFQGKSVINQTLNLNGEKVLLTRVDSCFRDFPAMGQGQFPVDEFIEEISKLNVNDFDLRVMMLHHHLTDYLEKSEGTVKYIRHELAIKTRNSYRASKVVENSQYDLVLHGHKHKQGHKLFLSKNHQGMYCASPSAILDKKGEEDIVGLNLMIVEKHHVFILEFEYDIINNHYVCRNVSRIIR